MARAVLRCGVLLLVVAGQASAPSAAPSSAPLPCLGETTTAAILNYRNLSGAAALITGGASGLGNAAALALLSGRAPTLQADRRHPGRPRIWASDASLDGGAEDADEDALAELGLGARYLVWANSRRGDAGLVYPAYAPPSPQRSARPSSGRLARARAHLARLSSSRAR